MGDQNAVTDVGPTGLATYRPVLCVADFVVLVSGSRSDVGGVRDEVAVVLAPMGLRLSGTKTPCAHFDEGVGTSSASASSPSGSRRTTRSVCSTR